MTVSISVANWTKKRLLNSPEQNKNNDIKALCNTEMDKKTEEGLKMAEAIFKGTKTAVTVTFKDDKTVVMKMDMIVFALR